MMNLELLTKQVANLSRSVGNYLRSEIKNIRREDIKSKGMNDFVTYADKSSEKKLVLELSKLLPEAGFIAEENEDYKTADHYNWIIDPLDGTTNYIHGIPAFSISIALTSGKDIELGVIYDINLQECFYAWKDGGAFVNGHPIQCSSVPEIKDSLVGTGFPYSNYNRLDGFLGLFTHLLKSSHGVRRLGSAALDLAYVACGRFDGFYEYGLHPWDVAAGSRIVKEAGGTVSDFKGEENYIYGEEIVATNPLIYQQFLDLVRRYF
jgi:myo-inositol-1(or 4)-monophosphatase